MPGEVPNVFGDALRRLAGTATYLYQDGPRYWYSTQPTVTKLAEDRAEQLNRDPDKVARELDERIRVDLRKQGIFSRIHPLPHKGHDVPDDHDARLVVLSAEHAYSKEKGNAAEKAAAAILEYRGTSPRIYRNTLVFLAADKTRMQDLDEALRRYVAWESILDEKEALDLSPFQVKQAETQKASADSAVNARLPEAYQWLLVPVQESPDVPVSWQSFRLTGQDALAVRASKKLKSEELYLCAFSATRLKMELDKIPLWRGDHVSVRQLVEDFARYSYLPRFRDSDVLLDAIRSGVEALTWEDNFAYAAAYDEAKGRYLGLEAGKTISIIVDDHSILVKPETAKRQIDEDRRKREAEKEEGREGLGEEDGGKTPGGDGGEVTPPKPQPKALPRRFYGTAELDAVRLSRDASRIAEEIVQHFCSLEGCDVKVTLEIRATIPDGASDTLVRTITENCSTLKFSSHGFEKE